MDKSSMSSLDFAPLLASGLPPGAAKWDLTRLTGSPIHGKDAMVEVIGGDRVGASADYDNRALARDPRRVAVTDLPIIDLSPFIAESAHAERMRMARQLRAACIDIGFFYVTGHGFSNSELDAVLTQGRSFFALPLAEKMQVLSRNVDMPGFVRTGGIDPEKNRDKVVDIKERFSLTRELARGEQARPDSRIGRTQWPAREKLPAFEITMKAYVARLQQVSRALNHAFALSLDLPEDYFDALYQRPDMTLTFNFYPPVDPSKLKATQWSFSPHADYTAFTVLLQDSNGGLQARNSAGDWIDVPSKDGTLVVNVGNLLARWTNDLYASTLHRALHVGSEPRISAAFFVYPDATSVVRCIETCQGPDNPPRYEDVTTAEYVRVLREDAHRTGRPAVAADTAKRLQAT
jgi:isopenicillin N synthase-like dioxygenase